METIIPFPNSATPERRAAVASFMAHLETHADLWSDQIKLPGIVENIASLWRLNRNAPEDIREGFVARYKEQIEAIAKQAFIEGAYRMYEGAREEITRLRAERDSLAAQIAVAVEGLRPFAMNDFKCDGADDESVDLFYGEGESWHIGTVMLGDLRTAAHILSNLGPTSQAWIELKEAAKKVSDAQMLSEEQFSALEELDSALSKLGGG